MKTLINKKSVPPGGFAFKDPEPRLNNRVTRGATLAKCIEDAARFRQINDIPVPEDFPYRVEDQICRRLHPSLCRERTLFGKMVDGVRRVVNSVNLSVDVLMRGSKAFFSMCRAGNFEPDLEKVEARAKTCSRCPLHKDSSGCIACSISGAMQKAIPHARRALVKKYNLRACSVCQCVATAKVQLKHPVVRRLTSDAHFALLPSSCWIKTEIPNEEAPS